MTIQDDLKALRSKYSDEEFQAGLLAFNNKIREEKIPQIAAIVAEAFVHMKAIKKFVDEDEDNDYSGYGMEDLEWEAAKSRLVGKPIAAVIVEAMSLLNSAQRLASKWHIPFHMNYHSLSIRGLIEGENEPFDSDWWVPSTC